MPPIVDLNGTLVRADAAEVTVSDLGVLYGIGLFETMRSYAGHAFRFRQHMDRLLASAEKLKLPFLREMLPDEGRIVALLKANNLSDARLRLTISGGSPAEEGLKHMVLTTAVPLEPVPDDYHTHGITVKVASQVQHTTDPLVGHKTTCFWPRLQALHEAQQYNCAEVLWFTETRQLAEGSISNVFIIKDGTAKTPPLDTPVLPGVTRSAVIELCEREKIPCLQSPLTIDDLLDADEAFLCNCIMEIVPVCRVERSAIGDEKVGPITKKLASAYRNLTEETSTA